VRVSFTPNPLAIAQTPGSAYSAIAGIASLLIISGAHKIGATGTLPFGIGARLAFQYLGVFHPVSLFDFGAIVARFISLSIYFNFSGYSGSCSLGIDREPTLNSCILSRKPTSCGCDNREMNLLNSSILFLLIKMAYVVKREPSIITTDWL
jgi:hypothetical protein